ncbi:S1 family peptidase [Dyella sp. Tek66A03]|uniref:S1 family peptidase n=1 Tax=Dyella sp. Tek66A03 TaxID=3458298 RepID=UPI00403E447D
MAQLPTANVLRRTFHIKLNDSIGTCFTVDHEGRQYIVTAKHVVGDFPGTGRIEIAQSAGWLSLPVRLVGFGQHGADIAVLATEQPISPPALPCPPDSTGLSVGQDTFFLGFPFGMRTDIPGINGPFPLPLVKKACVSTMTGDAHTLHTFLLDGINNLGFSGAPVVFYPPNGPAELRIAAVISGYQWNAAPIHFRNNATGALSDQQTALVMKENTGIVIAYSIVHAVQAIEANPIGALIRG